MYVYGTHIFILEKLKNLSLRKYLDLDLIVVSKYTYKHVALNIFDKNPLSFLLKSLSELLFTFL